MALAHRHHIQPDTTHQETMGETVDQGPVTAELPVITPNFMPPTDAQLSTPTDQVITPADNPLGTQVDAQVADDLGASGGNDSSEGSPAADKKKWYKRTPVVAGGAVVAVAGLLTAGAAIGRSGSSTESTKPSTPAAAAPANPNNDSVVIGGNAPTASPVTEPTAKPMTEEEFNKAHPTTSAEKNSSTSLMELNRVLPGEKSFTVHLSSGEEVKIPAIQDVSDPKRFAEIVFANEDCYISTGDPQCLAGFSQSMQKSELIPSRDQMPGVKNTGTQLVTYDLPSSPATFKFDGPDRDKHVKQTGGAVLFNVATGNNSWQSPNTHATNVNRSTSSGTMHGIDISYTVSGGEVTVTSIARTIN